MTQEEKNQLVQELFGKIMAFTCYRNIVSDDELGDMMQFMDRVGYPYADAIDPADDIGTNDAIRLGFKNAFYEFVESVMNEVSKKIDEVIT